MTWPLDTALPNLIDILLALAAFLVLFLLLPVQIVLRASRPSAGDATNLTVRSGFLAGLGGLQLRVEASRQYLSPCFGGHSIGFLTFPIGSRKADRQPASEPPPANDVSMDAEKTEEKPCVTPLIQKLRWGVYTLAKPGWSYLCSLRRIVGGLKLDLRARIGLSDPAQTGRLYGYASTLDALLGRRIRLRIAPNFTAPEVSGILDLRFRLHLGLLLGLTVLVAGRIVVRWLLHWFSARNREITATP